MEVNFIMNSYKNYLSHHGIKGQKWGVENGPPYPLNEVVKAVAYKGGDLGDGKRVENFTLKDVKKARKIVNKNLKTMTDAELKAYKDRLILERNIRDTVGNNTTEKLITKLKNNAIDAVADSVKQSGTQMLKNAEIAGVGEIISAAFNPDVAAMITDGLTKESLADKRATRRKTEAEAEEKELSNKEKRDKMNNDSSTNSNPKPTQETGSGSKPSASKPKATESAPKSEQDYKYVDREKVNGEWRYEYPEDTVKALTDKHNPYKSSKSADEYVYKEYLKDLKKQRKQEVYNSKQIAKLEKKKLKQDIYNSKKLAKMEAKQYKQSALATKKAIKQLTAKRSNPIYLPNTRNDGIIYLPDKS